MESKKLYNLYVGNLPLSCTEEDLYNCFSNFGDIGDIFIHPPSTTDHVTYAFVRYFDPQSVDDLLQGAASRRFVIHRTGTVVEKGRDFVAKNQKNFCVPSCMKTTLPSNHVEQDIDRIAELKKAYLKVTESSPESYAGCLGFDELILQISHESTSSFTPVPKVLFDGFHLDVAKLDLIASESATL